MTKKELPKDLLDQSAKSFREKEVGKKLKYPMVQVCMPPVGIMFFEDEEYFHNPSFVEFFNEFWRKIEKEWESVAKSQLKEILRSLSRDLSFVAITFNLRLIRISPLVEYSLINICADVSPREERTSYSVRVEDRTLSLSDFSRGSEELFRDIFRPYDKK